MWISRWRLLGALLLGHLAAAYGFSAAMLVYVSLTDPATSLPRTPGAFLTLAHDAAFLPLLAGAISLWTAFLMLPASLLSAPIAYWAARRLRVELPAALAIGGAIGVGYVILGLACSVVFGPPERHAVPDALRLILMFLVCSAAAGMAHAAVTWRLCIRPRLDRCGAARWLEV